MRPIPKFQYHSPESVSEALSLLVELENASPVIGGSDLMIAMRNGVIAPSHVVDLNEINELNYIKEEAGVIKIGATATHTQVASNLIVAQVHSLVDSVSRIGSPQIRNRGTITGNICNASPAADSAPPLLVHGAEVEIKSLDGSRVIPIADLFTGPKMNCLETGELLTEIRIPVPPAGAASSYKRIGRRKAFTLSVVSSAAYIQMDDETCTDAKVAFGSVAITPIRVPEAENLLKGSKLDKETIKAASKAVYEAVKPITDVRGTAEYRKDMCPVLMRRAIDQCLERLR
ncbi:xanthine dehydrogenase family protein subunit M [Candidatus Bathyarchaeota archaeon]|jgi:CO/xanthine dehydrogenase FAD-binding subunit|nr:xanthine dehydrogenase family protein subunit M [Candidatus Bathyarchaeota archaeon]MBT4319052.1 xanthine dehydrogenase family protein subunit M [Candidatus Bathyarchaeota archaeon]MBT4424372.1 xanthine dehydrogenase family protein subunit M [Candidatus Bathyarchaeota archaeon]MBT5642880.1 xanthine dehydrogenase family protein subunit M [Candidatus Bathyarchaeota archaeon]MBT7187829.1 xanthine dehydrogenase family protein subunit M [Candidatus Bathyarchaeota archaeon]